MIVSGSLPVERGEQLVGPGVGGQDHLARPEGPGRSGLDLDRSVGLPQAGHGRPLEQDGAVGAGQPLVRGVGPIGIGQAALGLEHRGRIVGQPPLGPATHRLSRVEDLEGDPFGRQALGIVRHRDRGPGRPQVEATRPGHDLDARLRLHLVPGREGSLRQPDVVGPVVRQPDDPGVVLAGPVGVTELELLEAQDIASQPPAEPVRGAAADPAQANHGHRVVAARPAAHLSDQPYRRVSSRTTQPPSSTEPSACSRVNRREPRPCRISRSRPRRAVITTAAAPVASSSAIPTPAAR